MAILLLLFRLPLESSNLGLVMSELILGVLKTICSLFIIKIYAQRHYQID